MKILIVDDSRVARRSIRKILSGLMDIEFFEAESGESALEVVATETPDLIFTDWYMDKMDGLEMISKIREDNNPVKICMITSEANEEKLATAMNVGADYIVGKPIKLNELAKAFETLIG